MILSKLRVFLELIKFEHTAFALPFAYLGLWAATGGRPGWRLFFWVSLAMFGARTAGMSLNRLADADIDRLNPRTRNRPLVAGRFTKKAAWTAAALAAGVFFGSAYALGPLCFGLSFAAVVLLGGYHFVKRFSWASHFVLGLVLAAAPMGGWIAARGSFGLPPSLLALAVLFWVAGFDILYALQDEAFDREHGLHSVPARFGTGRALKISAACHATTMVFFAAFGVISGLGLVYWAGLAVVGGLLWAEHALLSENDLSRLETSFFTINGWIGILLFAFTFLETFR